MTASDSSSKADKISIDIAHLYVHKTRIHPNNKQADFLDHCCSVSKTAYNWGLRWWKLERECLKEYKIGGSPSAFKADKAFNKIKKERFPWMYDQGKIIAPSCVGQKAICKSLKFAFDNFFTRLKKGLTGKQAGFPKFKKKPQSSFELTNVVVKSEHIQGNRIKLPKGMGWVKMGSTPKYSGKVQSTTISRIAGKWYVSVRYTTDSPIKHHQVSNKKVTGIDVGIARYAVLSDGKSFEAVNAYKTLRKKKARAQRKLSRMQGPDKRKNQKPSNGWVKQKQKVAIIERQIACLRENNAHQVSSKIAKSYSTIFMEDLKIKNMTKRAKLKNVAQKRGLNRSMLDAGLHDFRTKVSYKTKRHGGVLHLVNPAYTSQQCAACGHISKENRKTQANFKCVECGQEENADLNAARNIHVRGLQELSTEEKSRRDSSRARQKSGTLVEA